MKLAIPKMISDPEHPCIAHINRLRKREYRERDGLVIVEGYPEVTRAVRAGIPMKVVYVCSDVVSLKPGELGEADIIEVTEEVFAEMAYGKRIKGILALCEFIRRKLEDVPLKKNPLVVVLERVEKPGNLGGIIRSCDGARADCVIMCDGKTDIYNQHVVRSSMGTVFMVPTVDASQQETYLFLREHGLKIIAATSRAQQIHTKTDLTRPCAIVLGTEHEGLSSFWLEHADEQVKIPMLGDGQCLNVNASASILVYEALRQRREVL